MASLIPSPTAVQAIDPGLRADGIACVFVPSIFSAGPQIPLSLTRNVREEAPGQGQGTSEGEVWEGVEGRREISDLFRIVCVTFGVIVQI